MSEAPVIRDADGVLLRVGDVVRVIAEPDLSGIAPPYREETAAVFRHIKGTRKRIREFDQFKCAILVFSINAGPHAGYQSVAIEPELIRKVRRKAKTGHDT